MGAIHPSIFYHITEIRLRVLQPKQGSPDFVQCPGSSLGLPTGGTCPEQLTKETSGFAF